MSFGSERDFPVNKNGVLEKNLAEVGKEKVGRRWREGASHFPAKGEVAAGVAPYQDRRHPAAAVESGPAQRPCKQAKCRRETRAVARRRSFEEQARDEFVE
jgi:hypothetical protein